MAQKFNIGDCVYITWYNHKVMAKVESVTRAQVLVSFIENGKRITVWITKRRVRKS
jgi:hypothetical protein